MKLLKLAKEGSQLKKQCAEAAGADHLLPLPITVGWQKRFSCDVIKTQEMCARYSLLPCKLDSRLDLDWLKEHIVGLPKELSECELSWAMLITLHL